MPHWRLACLVLLVTPLLALGAPPAPPANAKAVAAYEEGQEMAGSGAHHFAIDRFQRALALEEHPDFHFALGRSFLAVERRKLAFFALRKALRKDPEDVETLVLVTDLAIEMGRFDEAESLVARLERLAADVAVSAALRLFCTRGEAALAEGRYRTAWRHFRRARDGSGDHERALGGCKKALLGIAGQLEAGGRAKPLLAVLLRLYRLAPSGDLARRIEGVFRVLGSPGDRKAEVTSILEHAAAEGGRAK